MHNQKLRNETLDAYGGKCNCCGETMREFLTIDHMNDDGAAHRRETGGGTGMYRDLKRRGYPDGYQVLCWNCNWGRRVNSGICPHVSRIQDMVDGLQLTA